MATDLGFDVNFDMNPKMYQYVIASGTSLTATVRSNEKAKILGITSIYTKTVHLRTEQLVQELKQIMHLLLTIEKTTGLNVLTASLLIPLASCLNTNESALLGILENAEVSSIRNCLVTLTGRPKKSSLFQYLFSNGAEVDALTNTMSEDISLINSNFNAIQHNERANQHSLALNQKTMKSLDAQAKQALKNELAFQIHADLERQIIRANMVLDSQTDLLQQHLLAHKTALIQFHKLLVAALLHSNAVTCDTTGCIDPTTSRVSLPDGTTILVSYTLHQLLRVNMVFVSCVPASAFDISVYHGRTFVLSNDSSALSCPVSGQTFFLRDLLNNTFTNSNTKLLDETLLYFENILILLDEGYYRFFCLQDELIIYGPHKIKCTDHVSEKFHQGQHEIWTARGTILFQDMQMEKLHSKKRLLANIGAFNYEAFTTLHTNLTLADIGPLEAFQNLGPVQQAGIVGGLGLVIFSLCCGAVCCFLFRKRLSSCSLPCASTHPAPEQSVRQEPTPPQQEESLRQQLRAAAQFHLRQLNPSQLPPTV